MDKKLIRKLTKRKEEGTLRSLSHFEGFTDFFSNDYLGLSKKTASINELSGGTGSRLISGTTARILEAESRMAKFFGADAALHFNSGYDANVGFFSAVPQRGDTIVFDELIHASVRDGIRMGFADSVSFRHNDVDDLRLKLSRIDGTIYVAIESIYSMDGDLANLGDIVDVCEEFDAYLIVDEAHTAGIFGENGKGLAYAFRDRIFARLITFGKAYGSHGACVLGATELIQFLTNFARSFIYTTALPESVYELNANRVEHEELEIRQKTLHTLLKNFRDQYSADNLISNPESPIQIIEIGDVERTRLMADRLQGQRIAVKPIFAPTVPVGRERLRLCFHSYNTLEEVNQLLAIVNEF